MLEKNITFQNIVKNIQDIAYRMSLPDGTYEFVNSVSEKITGYTPEEFYKKPLLIRKIIHPEFKEYFKKEWSKLLEGEMPETYEYKIIHKSGDVRWLNQKNVLVRDSSGRIIAIDGIIRDVTEQKNTQINLEESERKFKNIFENSSQGKIIAGLDGVLKVNKVFCRILGYSETEIQNKNWKEYTHPDDIKMTEDSARKLLDGKVESVNYEKRYIHKNGSVIYVDIVDSLLKDFYGNPKHFITSIVDITEQKRIKFKNDKLLKELERSNKELEQFAYVASHDLQEPLRKIKNFTELFAEKFSGILDDKAKQYIGYITSGAERMQTLIQDLLEYSRITTRGEGFKKSDLNAIVWQVVDNLQMLINENNAKVLCEKLPLLEVDSSQINRVFQNIISNAIKYRGQKDPVINISGTEKNDYWEFCISDNGIGLDMKYADRIFETFQRLHSKDKYEGTGIGLAICKKIIERHGGKIWVKSEPEDASYGKSARTMFCFTIPKKSKI